ncbi:uncharacterized protein LOC110730841 [Chenopodium quinoa]|uniref:uncharacterized protein LOC110730841 n=1 Tax=Chenopodium quinoa TaxID=63459 RepID=UPI000B771258|nr:uncharacterized protein LOC110730841 [Chenopodium quinoa]
MGVKKRKTPKQPTTTAAGETPPVGPGIEFRNLEDDAWYNIQLLLQNQTLLVKFIEFPDDHDLEFHTTEFSSSGEISDFRRRFRPLTLQFEPSDCVKVKLGMRVCALMNSVICRDDRRFYDAIVEGVKREEHTIVDETENCSCTVILSWLHGPKAGTLTTARVEDLCPIQPPRLDPRVACFLELAKWKQGITSPCSNLINEDITYNEESPTSLNCQRWNVIQNLEDERQMGSIVPYDEGNIGHEKNEDVDLGGGGDNVHAKERLNDDNYFYSLEKLVADVCSIGLGGRDNGATEVVDTEVRYFIVIENLEKDISSSTIVEFVLEETGLEIEAFVLLSLSAEPYTRGALVVKCAEDLERLCNFLVKPDQMITSSKGRPWIVSDTSATESVRPSFWCLEPDLKDERQQSAGDGLRVVQSGSEEYSKAEKLRDLYLAFTTHQQQLSKRLALEEQRILDA